MQNTDTTSSSSPLDALSPYRLTLVGGVVIVIVSVGLVEIFGTSDQAKAYLAFVASAGVPLLLALFKLEQNSVVGAARHAENKQVLANLADSQHQLVDDNLAVKNALLAIRNADLPIEEAARQAAEAIQQQQPPPVPGGEEKGPATHA
jgi:hypothetical protein